MFIAAYCQRIVAFGFLLTRSLLTRCEASLLGAIGSFKLVVGRFILARRTLFKFVFATVAVSQRTVVSAETVAMPEIALVAVSAVIVAAETSATLAEISAVAIISVTAETAAFAVVTA